MKTIVTGALLLLATGCNVGPDYVRPKVPLNAGWTATDPRLATQKAVEAGWWHSFKDPTLDRLIDFAYLENPPLQIAGLRILEARAQLGIAVGQQYPINPSPIASRPGRGPQRHIPRMARI